MKQGEPTTLGNRLAEEITMNCSSLSAIVPV